MFAKQYPAEVFLRFTEQQFTQEYESVENQRFLDYLENRIRFELISLINTLDRKGDITIEVRKKGSLSALNKIFKEMKRTTNSSNVKLQDIVKDFIGCRIVCIDESALVNTFKALLQSEEFKILNDGFEIYSAPFRKYENGSSRYLRMVGKLGLDKELKKPIDEIKYTNYESLHCYLNFTRSDRINLGVAEAVSGERGPSRENRYRTEMENLQHLYDEMTDSQKGLILDFPIECQLRTVLEHLWSVEEHRYVYEKVKSGKMPENDPKKSILRDAFVALKYHYSAIDDVRDVIRNISNDPGEENLYYYTGTSKDIGGVRAAYFEQNDHSLKLVQEAAEVYESTLVEGQTAKNDEMQKVYRKLHAAYVSIKQPYENLDGDTK
jgi:ppGpp synthetase/RelA/SpoT-type nucleotidyltranferase